MRRFMMIRRTDETGVSGVGHVADGVVFDDGTVAIRWRTSTTSSAFYDSLDAARKIHGHDGKTIFEFHDDDAPVVWLCCMCFSDMDPPVNHCCQCGAGGSAVAMSKSQLDEIQRHDKHRVEANNELRRELAAMRRVVIDVYGPNAVGLEVSRFTGGDGEEFVSLRRGSTTYGIRPEPGETDEAFMRRAGESASFDPDHIRRVHAERRSPHAKDRP